MQMPQGGSLQTGVAGETLARIVTEPSAGSKGALSLRVMRVLITQ